MFTKKDTKLAKQKRHFHIRHKVEGTSAMPRLTVFKSSKHIYAQIIDDENQTTLASASSLEKEISGKVKNAASIEAAKLVGELIAKRANEKKIETIVFDRSGYIYHGKVQALAEAARENGLKF